jgi:hypothetical protein
MSKAATSAADDEFYEAHPEMVTDDGERRPIDPHDPTQAQLRHEWMQAYVENGGQVREIKPKTQAAQVRQAAQEAKDLPPDTVAPAPVTPCSGANGKGSNGASGTDDPAGCDLKTVATAPRPKKHSPKPCKLVSTTCTCEHGRHPGEDGVLCVVPDSYGSIGDKITCVAQVIGGCGEHIEWDIDGAWTWTEHSAKTSFNAKTFKPAIFGWLKLYKVDPQTYRANAMACEGGAPGYEIRAYPPDKIEAKLDFTKIRNAIHDGFSMAPIEEKPEIGHLAISCDEQWKEDKGSPRAFCECSVAGGADPLFKCGHDFPVYPLSLIPPGLEDYIELGCYITIEGEIAFKVAWVGKYWPDEAKWEHDKFEVALECKVEGSLCAKLFLMNEHVLKAEIGGVTNLTGEAKAESGEEPGVEMELKWGGLEAVITIEAAWGFFEYKRHYPILKERSMWKRNYPFGGEKKEAPGGEE